MRNNTLKSSFGFTLIELLVVIAIIGILATVVVSSLNSARQKGSDAAIKQTINNMRAQAELFYDDNNSYSAMCDNGNIQEAVTTVTNAGSATVLCIDGDDVTNAWAIQAQLVASTTQYYCVDSTGASEVLTGSSISNTSGSQDAQCG